jgi:hypothetical protein
MISGSAWVFFISDEQSDEDFLSPFLLKTRHAHRKLREDVSQSDGSGMLRNRAHSHDVLVIQSSCRPEIEGAIKLSTKLCGLLGKLNAVA